MPTVAGNLEDDSLSFGVMQMARGKAFLLGTNAPAAGVSKQWLVLNGRQFLVEAMPVADITNELSQLPVAQTASIKANPPLNVVSSRRLLPAQRLATGPGHRSMQVAKAAPPSPGLVLDYLTLNYSTNNYTFHGDTTYFISEAVNLSGTSVIEGGSVLKFTNGTGGCLTFNGPVICQTGPYRPAVLTAKDDNSVGETIANSTGNPEAGGNYGGTAITYQYSGAPLSVHDLRLCYNYSGISIGVSGTHTVRDCQFYKVAYPLVAVGCTVNVQNMLMHRVSGMGLESVGATFNVVNLTAHQVSLLAYSVFGGWDFSLTNSLFISVTNLSGWPGITGAYNSTSSSDAGIFQTVGAGAHYLAASSPYRNAGTANIDPTLLADLQTKTTQPPPTIYAATTLSGGPPIDFSPQAPRDTDTPDLGYHYDPIDYAFGGVLLSNLTLIVNPGTVIGTFGTNSNYGLSVGSGAQFICAGSPANLVHIVTYNTVQEQPSSSWQAPTQASITDNYGGSGGQFSARFTDWSALGSIPHMALYQSQSAPANLQDCQFHSGMLISMIGPTINLTNCLLERVYAILLPDDASTTPVLCNNTFFGGTLSLLPMGNYQAEVMDNLFDRTTITDESSYYTYTGGNNAYVSGYNRLLPTAVADVILNASPVYATGPLGNRYIGSPALSSLLNAGSRSASDAGLTAYTIQANQTPDTDMVDIGFHYHIFSAPLDVVFILDNTESMEGFGFTFWNARDAILNVLDYIVDYSSGDYRLALVTPDDDIVDVQVNFSANNRVEFQNALDSVPIWPGGCGEAESTDECLNTVVNALRASGRVDIHDCSARGTNGCPPSTTLQIGDFSAFRPSAIKLVVLITDAPPSGFCDAERPYDDPYYNLSEFEPQANSYAANAATQGIKINAIQIGSDSNAATVMQDYSNISCGWYSAWPYSLSSGDAESAIMNMFNTGGACNP